MNKYFKYFPVLITIVILTISLNQTKLLLEKHFTHIDDIGVAYTILNANLCKTLIEKNDKYSNIPILKFIVANLKNSINSCEYLNKFYLYISIPAHWTYAPFQFFFTALSLELANLNTYEDVKYYGRLPSLIFYLLGILFFIFILCKKNYLNYNNFYLASAVLMIMGTSLELRIMASQMESYAIGLFSGVLIFMSTISLYKNRSESFSQVFYRCILMTAGIAMQYQGIILASSGILAIITIDFIKKDSYKKLLKKIIYILLSLIILSPCYLLFLIKNLGKGTNWNAGPNDVFIVSGLTINDKLIDFFRLIYYETSYNLYSLITPVEISDDYATIIGFFVIIFFILGMMQLYFTKYNPINYLTFIIIVTYSAFTALLIFFGIISFGPTRHSLYHLLPLVIGMAFGFQWLNLHFPKIRFDLLIFNLLTLISIISLINFDQFLKKRYDSLPQEIIKKYLFSDNPDLIIGDSVEIAFFENTKNKFIYINEYVSCDKVDPSFFLKNNFNIITYSKQKNSKLFDDYFINDYLNKYYKLCGYTNYHVYVNSKQMLFTYDGFEQVDISNKTQNGTNSIYFYKFKVYVDN